MDRTGYVLICEKQKEKVNFYYGESFLGGPAEKGGLQQGDKILEWCGVSLVDRSFEEVCSIMDRTADIAELLVEHASDFRMCDLLEDNNGPQHGAPNSQANLTNPVINVNQRKNSDVGLIAGKTQPKRPP